MTIYPVILAGGRGTRLWPLSRGDKPKQFLKLHGDLSLFQQAVLRHHGRENVAEPWIVCGAGDYFQVDDALRSIGVSGSVVLEPESRNTAPAIAAVAAALRAVDPDAILLVLPSDHLVDPDEGYFRTLEAALSSAASGQMVSFGIVPTYPETGYGYIKAADTADGLVLPVERFIEKPPIVEAAAMVSAGTYYWNAGFFALSASAFLTELAQTAPEVATAATQAFEQSSVSNRVITLDRDEFAAAPEISIDYALFERTTRASVAPLSCRWSDVGSWRAYWDTVEKDDENNALIGKALAVDSKNSLIMSRRPDVIGLGLDGMAVIAAEDAVLVCPLDRAQDVKAVVAMLKDEKRQDLLDVSPTVSRPWGGFTSIMSGSRFQVKHLFVLPGKKLSLQKHFHRAEHWVVVRGTAEVTIDDSTVTLTENQSTYLPLGAVHRLANPGKIMLEVIEVQTGSYLGEDDIVRIADEFGRT